MSAADFAHHDDMRPLEPTAWMSRRDDALTQWQSATPVLPHLTREDLRASREELLAALDAERAANAVAWGLVDDLFDRLKGRHRTTTPQRKRPRNDHEETSTTEVKAGEPLGDSETDGGRGDVARAGCLAVGAFARSVCGACRAWQGVGCDQR